MYSVLITEFEVGNGSPFVGHRVGKVDHGSLILWVSCVVGQYL